jgi:hypothetical protein
VLETKPVPVSETVIGPDPVTKLDGVNPEMLGIGLSTSRVIVEPLLDEPFEATTGNIAALASRPAGTAAVNCVALP